MRSLKTSNLPLCSNAMPTGLFMSDKYWSLPFAFQKFSLLLLLAGNFLLTWFCLTFTTSRDHIAYLWFPAAFMTVVVFRCGSRHIFLNLLFCFAGILLADELVFGLSLRGFSFALLDVVQALVAGFTLRALLDRDRPFKTLQDLRHFALSAGLIIPLGSGLVAHELVKFSGQTIPNFFLIWVISRITAMLNLGPVLLKAPLPTRGMNISWRWLLRLSAILISTLLASYLLMPYLPWPFTLLMIILLWGAVQLPLLDAFVLFCAHITLVGVLLIAHKIIHPVYDSMNSLLSHWLPLMLALLPSLVMAMVMDAFRREKDRIYESEERFRHALDHMTIGMALKKPRGPWKMINQSFSDLLGYQIEEINLIGFEQLTHPDDRARDRQQADAILHGEATRYTCEKRYLHKKGHIVWVKRTLSLIYDDRQRPLYYLLQVVDLTEIKQSEQANKGLQAQMTLANEAGGISVWELNLTTGQRKWDKTIYRLYGLPEDTLPSENAWMSKLHPDDQMRVKSSIQQAIEKQQPAFVFEYRVMHPLGIKYLRSYANLMTNTQGHEILVGISQDITHDHILQEALHQEKERMLITLSSIGEAVISTDESMNVIYMNPAAERFSGWTQSEAAGKAVSDILHITHGINGSPLDAAHFQQPPQEKVSPHIEQELVLHNRNGILLDIYYSITPLNTMEGEVIGAVIIISDVSESRTLLKSLNYNASHDILTNLPNRASFEQQLRALLKNVAHTEQRHTLAFIDLDKFKAVNDNAGHAAGDALLCELAELMKKTMRSSDFLARLGGDEFGLIMPDTNIVNAQPTIQRIVDAVNEYRFEWKGEIYRVGASSGITRIDRTNNHYEEVVSQADLACYKAKHQGRGQYAIF